MCQQCVHTGFRLHRYTCLYTHFTDFSAQLNAGIHILHSFQMKGDNICTCLGEDFRNHIRIIYHDMNIHYHIHCFFKALEKVRSKGQIRYKMAIHNIKMHPFRIAFIQLLQLFTRSGIVQ